MNQSSTNTSRQTPSTSPTAHKITTTDPRFSNGPRHPVVLQGQTYAHKAASGRTVGENVPAANKNPANTRLELMFEKVLQQNAHILEL